jgi:hypothetical protein
VEKNGENLVKSGKKWKNKKILFAIIKSALLQ